MEPAGVVVVVAVTATAVGDSHRCGFRSNDGNDDDDDDDVPVP